MISMHDIPGSHVVSLPLPGFGTAEDGQRRFLFQMPFRGSVSAEIYMAGTANVGHATNYFKLITYIDDTPVGTVNYGTPVTPWGTPRTLYAGTVPEGAKIAVGYGTVGSGLDAPASLVVITFVAT